MSAQDTPPLPPPSAAEPGPLLDKLEALLARQRAPAAAPALPRAPAPAPAPTRTPTVPPPATRAPTEAPPAIPVLREAVALPGVQGPVAAPDAVPTLTDALPPPRPEAAIPTGAAPASRESLRGALAARLPADLESQVRARALTVIDRVVEDQSRALALWRQRQAAALEVQVRAAIDRAIDEAIDRALLGSGAPPRR